MKIKALNPKDESMYDKLALLYGNIFYSVKWTNLFLDKVTRYGIYSNDDQLLGGFFLYKEKKYGLSIYIDPPFTPSIGPFIKINAQNPVSIMNSRKEILSLMADFFEDLGYSIISLSLNKDVIDTQPFIWSKFKVSPRYTYIFDLDQPIDNIKKNLHKKNRHCLKRAAEEGLVVQRVDDMKIVENLILKTFSRQGKKINESYLKKILFDFASAENSYAFVTFRNGRPSSTAFFVYDQDTSYAILGGYDHENIHYSAGTLHDWEGLKHAKSLKLKYFDFEGSMIPHIERYMRGFGGVLTPYYRISKAKLPIEMALKLVKRELF